MTRKRAGTTRSSEPTAQRLRNTIIPGIFRQRYYFPSSPFYSYFILDPKRPRASFFCSFERKEGLLVPSDGCLCGAGDICFCNCSHHSPNRISLRSNSSSSWGYFLLILSSGLFECGMWHRESWKPGTWRIRVVCYRNSFCFARGLRDGTFSLSFLALSGLIIDERRG